MTSTPTGRTGYPAWNPAVDEPDGAAQDLELGGHFDALVGETVPTAASLPASGNWVGRMIMTVDTLDVYVCSALPGTWKVVSSAAVTGTVTANGGAAGWSTTAETRLVKRAGRAVFDLSFSHASHTPATAGVLMGTIPSGFRPPQRIATPVVLAGAGELASVDIDTAGQVLLNNYASVAAVVTVRAQVIWDL